MEPDHAALAGLQRIGQLQRTTSESPSLGPVENLAFTLHWALLGMYSNRVLRLSRRETLRMAWMPRLSKRMVKSTSSPGSANNVEATLTTRSRGLAGCWSYA